MTYVIRSNGKKEQFDGEKLFSSIMAAADDAGISNDSGIQDLIRSITSNTSSYAQSQKEVQSNTLKQAILAQLLSIGVKLAMQKFGAKASKEDVISELINAGLQMSSRSSKSSSSNDLLSELLGAAMGSNSRSSSSSNDILSELLGAAMGSNSRSSSSSSNDLLSQILGAATGTSSRSSSSSNDILSELLGAAMGSSSRTSRASSSGADLDTLLKTGMKLANAWMQSSKSSGNARP
ncbi:MAG TPA: hypothetical protein PKH48_07640 [Methanofastidiosum sp.]|nr:hypothetical protein [Methanofastidiosum sp.]